MDVDVLVVGSVNEDVVVSVERLPDPGETLLASELATSCGGKGANQAVAAARGGVRVAMVGAGLLHRLRERTGARSLVMTLGVCGALVDDGSGAHAIPPVVVERVVDATGAGDTFVGVLAARLALGEGLVAAASAANRSAAEAVTWPGARPPAE